MFKSEISLLINYLNCCLRRPATSGTNLSVFLIEALYLWSFFVTPPAHLVMSDALVSALTTIHVALALADVLFENTPWVNEHHVELITL
jgi:hypothetical protein